MERGCLKALINLQSFQTQSPQKALELTHTCARSHVAHIGYWHLWAAFTAKKMEGDPYLSLQSQSFLWGWRVAGFLQEKLSQGIPLRGTHLPALAVHCEQAAHVGEG